jgi:hypothetical protein
LNAVTDSRDRFAEIADKVALGDTSAMRELRRLVGGIAANARADEVAWLRLGLAQLADPGLDRSMRAEIESLDDILDGVEHELDGARARALAIADRQILRNRVLDSLKTGELVRPKDLVRTCGADAYQVSRALRELRAEGLVEITQAPPDGAGDRRAAWYRSTRVIAQGGDKPLPFRLLVSGSFTYGTCIRPLVNDVPVWEGETLGARVDPEQALEGLARAWLPLLLEDGLPSNWTPSNLDAIGANRPAPDPERLQSFTQCHDLAQVLGTSEQPIWLSREGNRCWILTKSATVNAFHSDVMHELTALGNALEKEVAARPSSRSTQAVAAWSLRSEHDSTTVVEISTQLDQSVLEVISSGADPDAFWELDDLADSSELVMAARMASALDPRDIATVVEAIRSAPMRKTEAADKLSAEALGVLESASHLQPYEQGQLLASWMRAELLAEPSGRVDPAVVLESWNVQTIETTIAATVDGFACWGPRHGPMVAVNLAGKRSQSEAGRRSTLAHEIAHLLLDRNAALPLAEVLGGQTAPICEARANAFAAELLLPREEAGRRLARTADPAGEVEALISDYGVSREVVAWQARNSGVSLPLATFNHLKSLVPRFRYF